MESAGELGRGAPLDLHRPDLARAEVDDEANLRAAGRAVVAERRAGGQGAGDVLDDEALPTAADDRVAEQVVDGLDAQQGVTDAAVADVDLRRLDQPPAQVGGPRLESADEQQVDQQVEVPGDRDAVDVQPAREGRRVVRLPLVVGEHRPEPAQGLGGNARTELRNVAFEVRADEGDPPVEALGVVGREEAVGETAAAPEPALGVGGDLGRAEGMELALGDAARERLARLPQQLDGRRSETASARPGRRKPLSETAFPLRTRSA